MIRVLRLLLLVTSRSPHGERGLKLLVVHLWLYERISRSPHGERGLKFMREILNN